MGHLPGAQQKGGDGCMVIGGLSSDSCKAVIGGKTKNRCNMTLV